MLTPFIYDTSSVQDRLIQAGQIKSGLSSKSPYGAGREKHTGGSANTNLNKTGQTNVVMPRK